MLRFLGTRTMNLAFAAVIVSTIACNRGQEQIESLNSQVQTLTAQLKKMTDEAEGTDKNLKNFDTLDFAVFTGQKWDRLGESHSKDIKVFWPDGHMTQGIDKHIEDLKAMFVFAPDTRVLVHPIRTGSGKFTAVTGVMEGTFTKPMPIGNGKLIQPTGKAYKLPMATFGIWENGVMVEEHLFWDNLAFMKQIGAM